MIDIAGNCRKVIETIHQAAQRSGRGIDEIKLLAASKSQESEALRAAFAAGIRLFGENYVQEAAAKKKTLADIADSMEWHMIGHLQRNKVRSALALFSVIETLDSFELGRMLHEEAQKRQTIVGTLVEVNLAGEESKAGISPESILPLLERLKELNHLKVEGLMAVPPMRQDPEESRPYFRRLKNLQTQLSGLRIANVEMKELSMGMSHDYPVAIEEGATIVRIGTAIFGPRSR